MTLRTRFASWKAAILLSWSNKQTFFISLFFLVLWAPEVSRSTNDDSFCLWLLQRVSSCSLGLAIALGSFTSSPFEARLGLGSVSLIDMDDKTFDVCSGFTCYVKYKERSAPVIARFVFQATPFLATVGRLVLKGLFLFCCCVLVLEQGVDGLADSAFAVDYLLFQFPFFSPPRCPLLENVFPSRHRSWRERLGAHTLLCGRTGPKSPSSCGRVLVDGLPFLFFRRRRTHGNLSLTPLCNLSCLCWAAFCDCCASCGMVCGARRSKGSES